MEKSGASQIPVTEEQLNAYKEEVTALLKMVSWSRRIERSRPASNTAYLMPAFCCTSARR